MRDAYSDEDIVPERLPGWSYPSDHVALLAELSLPAEGGGGEERAGGGQEESGTASTEVS